MGTAVNRTTKQYILSVSTPDFPTTDYIINSDQAAALFAAGVPSRYWNISGDDITEMTQAEKDALDKASLDGARDTTATIVDQLEGFDRALSGVLLDALNAHAAAVNAILAAADAATSDDMKKAMEKIDDLPAISFAELKDSLRKKLGT